MNPAIGPFSRLGQAEPAVVPWRTPIATPRIGVVVDSACDLPREFIHDENIVVMPITVRIGGNAFDDMRDPAETMAFYLSHLDRKSDEFAESIPYTAERIESLFLDHLVLDFDYVFCLTITSARSPIYYNAQQAAQKILLKAKARRVEAGLSSRFGLYVLSTQNLFAGQAIPAAEAIRLIKAGDSPSEIGERLRNLVEDVHAYLVPADLYHIYKRASKKGERSINFGSYAVGQMLDVKPILHCHRDETAPVAKLRGFDTAVAQMFANVTRQIRLGLSAPIVVISYGGEPTQVAKLPGYGELKTVARDYGVRILVSMMSTTGAVNVGPGAVSVAFAADRHHFE